MNVVNLTLIPYYIAICASMEIPISAIHAVENAASLAADESHKLIR